MPEWKGLRYQIRLNDESLPPNDRILAESRYFNMIVLLWHGLKPGVNVISSVIDNTKRKVFEPAEIEKAYNELTAQ